jgi:hypothetical protein
MTAARGAPGVAYQVITLRQTYAGHRTHASYVTDLTPKSLRTFALDSCD